MNKGTIIRDLLLSKKGRYDEIKMSSEYEKAKSEAENITDEFLDMLSEKEIEFFNEVYSKLINESSQNATDHYIEGFKVGFRLCLELIEN